MDKIEDIDGDIDGGKGFLKVSASPKHGSCYTELSRKEHVHDYSLHARACFIYFRFFSKQQMKLRTFLQEQESLLEEDADVTDDVEETSDQASVRLAFARVIFIPNWQFRLARDNNRITLELRLLTLSVCYCVLCCAVRAHDE